MKTILFAGAVLALSATVAWAQPARLDTNGDGKVSLAEFKAGRAGAMMRLDANKDGKISKAEFQAGGQRMAQKAPKGGQQKGDGSRMFGMMDANRDGSLDKAELAKLFERRFGRLDMDGDGSLSQTELQAARRGAGGMAGGGL